MIKLLVTALQHVNVWTPSDWLLFPLKKELGYSLPSVPGLPSAASKLLVYVLQLSRRPLFLLSVLSGQEPV